MGSSLHLRCHPTAWLVAVLLIPMVCGCSSSKQEEQSPPPLLSQAERESLPRAGGVPLGHIKPLSAGKTLWPAGKEIPSYITQRPHVRWVLDGEELTELDPPELLYTYRLDFDETRRLTFDDLPYVFMTENSREAVIRRGDVIEGHFEDSRISPDERIVLLYLCLNPHCPQSLKVQNEAKFPHDPSSGQLPVCPYCGSQNKQGESTSARRFKTTQAMLMEDLIRRQFYRDRERKKNQE